MFSYFGAYTFDVSFVSFAIFRTVSKVKKKDALVRSSALLKFFLNKRFAFLKYLENEYSNSKAANFFSHNIK